MDEKLQKFCENFEIKILDDNKKRYISRPYELFSDPNDADIIRRNSGYTTTEKAYTLEISESKLKALIEIENRFFNNMHHEPYHIDTFESIMDLEFERRRLTKEHEGVRKAFEQYSLMLHLAGFKNSID